VIGRVVSVDQAAKSLSIERAGKSPKEITHR
jgi:hypothetical protein